MKTNKQHRLAFRFLLFLIIAVNMPLKLFAYASEYMPGWVLDYDNSLTYKLIRVDDKEWALAFAYVKDTTIVNLNIPSEVTYNNYYGGEYRVPDQSTMKVTTINDLSYEIWEPNYFIFYPLYLRSINIPYTVTSIAEGVFKPYYERIDFRVNPYDDSHLAELMEINVHPDNPNYSSVDGVLYNKDKSVLIACPAARTECNIPASVTQIANYAFGECRNLKSLTIPSSVTKIGDNAFEGCVNLQNIAIPESVDSIGDYAFKNCKSLISVNLTAALKSIGDYAFAGCDGLETLNIPNSVTQIGAYAFEGCTNLKAITIPESVTAIGDYSFKNCKSLVSVNLPAALKSIGDHAFAGCDGLETLNIPNSVTQIGAYAFEGCTNLKAITIPESVTAIGDYAFKNCKSLVSVNLPAALTSICCDIFSGCDRLKEIHVSPDNDRFADVDGVLYDKNLSQLLICPKGLAGELTIPSSVTTIGENAFKDCVSLTAVNLPASVTTIGESAFNGCTSLSEITIPASVEYIGWEAFENCTSLLTICSKGMTPPTTESSAFRGVPIIAYVYVPQRTVPLYKASKAWSDFYYFFEVDEWVTGISDITDDAATAPQDVYTLQGVCVRRAATEADINALPRGIYIIGGRKVYVK